MYDYTRGNIVNNPSYYHVNNMFLNISLILIPNLTVLNIL